jgi:hypothetical protein
VNKVYQLLDHLDLRVTSVLLEEKENVETLEIRVSMVCKELQDTLVKRVTKENQGKYKKLTISKNSKKPLIY